MTCGPRVRISPSAPIFTSTPGTGGPTDPGFSRPGRLRQMTGEVSVRP